MTNRDAPHFPASSFPEPNDQKLLGIYQQRDTSFVLQRVRIPGGRIRPDQLHALAEAASRAAARPALHLTTRQCIEIHGLRPAVVPDTQSAIAAVGLTTVGSAGDTVRNSTVDPLGGRVPGNADLLSLALAIEATLGNMDGVWSLPRKFKISYSGDESASMRPWLSDVGVIACAPDRFQVVIGGSLGPRPGSGLPFGEVSSTAEVASLVVAAVRLHSEMGDREHRGRARLRHVRERLGDDGFRAALGLLWEEERALARTAVPPSAGMPGPEASRPYLRLAVPGGDVPLAAAKRLAKALECAHAEVRIGIEHDLHVFGIERDRLPAEIAEWATPRRLVACPGSALCSKAAGPTGDASEELWAMAARHPAVLFAVSGCANSCSHAAAAHVGVVSRMKRDDDGYAPVFRVVAGGDAGSGPHLSESVATDVPLEELAAVVEAALVRLRIPRSVPTPTGDDRDD